MGSEDRPAASRVWRSSCGRAASRAPALGIPAHSAALAHDVFNVACISVLVALNLVNWSFDAAAWSSFRITDGAETWATRWRGEYQGTLLLAVFLYVAIDILFIWVLPQSVKTPTAIVVHHLGCLAAMAIPYQYPATHGFTLGIFLTADYNTLFLLLRKMLLRTPDARAPWVPMARLVVSAGFYFTWVVVRMVLFPAWLFAVSWPEWVVAWERTGSPMNLFAVMPATNLLAVVLHVKWTWDLLSNVWRRRRSGRATGPADSAADDGNLHDPLRER